MAAVGSRNAGKIKSGDIAGCSLVRCTHDYEPKMDGHLPDTGDNPASDVDWVPGGGRASAQAITMSDGLSFHDADRDHG